MPEILQLSGERTLSVLPRGGTLFVHPCQQIHPAHLPALQACAEQWPQENRAVVEAIRQRFENTPNQTQYLACETAFFAGLPQVAASYALPGADAAGLRRFGTDGLMHAWAAARHPHHSRIVSVNLAANTSLAAICNGEAVDCSTGYSLLSGLPGLATCGEIDPSLVLFLAEQGRTPAQIRELLYKESGWQSFSRQPLTFEDFLNGGSAGLDLARSMYFHGIIKQIGAMLSVLGGAERVIIMCQSATFCEPLTERIRCHFQPYKLDFELIEVSKNEVLVSLAQNIQSLELP